MASERHDAAMTPLLDVARSLRRSNGRRAVLESLHVLGRADLGRVAERARMAPERVQAALVGGLPGFRVELSLVHLGLAEPAEAAEGSGYAITERGREVISLVGDGRKRRADKLPAAPAPRAPRHVCPACGVAS